MQSVLRSVVGPKEVRPDNLGGCVAIVTGGARGIGYEISRALAHAGYKVVIVSRTADHGHAAMAKIKEESPKAEVEWKECDMGELKQIKSVFSELRDSLDRIDFLVFSAGINANQYEVTGDGIERVFAINYLGQFYATNQLWPKIRATALTPGASPSKIVAISSELHRTAPSEVKFANLDEINDPSLSTVQLYSRSKLAQILFVKFGLAGKIIKPKWDPIYAFAVHPGTVSTDIQQQWTDAYPGVTGQLLKFAVTAVARDAEQGSYSTLWALTAPEIEDKQRNGAYFVDPEKPGSENSQTSDSILGAQLWELSEDIIKEKLGNDALIDWKKPSSP